MTGESLLLLCTAILFIAFLYSSVGHAGASGYIAVMALFGLAPSVIKPAALVLNIFVASFTAWQFWRAGHFSWRLFWPFAVTSVPFAFMGGYIDLPSGAIKVVIGIVLLYSAAWFFFHAKNEEEPRQGGKGAAVLVGAGFGFLSGLTGVGGGIFLTPLLIIMRWARTKTASAVSAFFIWVNSISGLGGNIASTGELPSFILLVTFPAVVGGIAGSYFGSRRFSPVVIKKLLAVVLLIAGAKLIFF